MYLVKIVMIDTIRLIHDIKVIPEEFRFSKTKKDIFSGILNPTKEMRASGKYYPRITFIKRPMRGGVQQQISIECSLPKLLKGNNFEEVCDVDFDNIVEALKRALWGMGVKWQFSSTIANYKVSRVDYSKNIVFNDGMTVSQILRLINNAQISGSMDASSSEFRNGGQILHLHTNARDIVFYDKIADLKQSRRSEKRAIENDNKCQLELLDYLQKKRNLAVLRFEIRLNSAREIRNNLKKIGLDDGDLSFKRLFSSDISRSILTHWWGEIYDKIPKALLDRDTPENFYIGILQDPRATPLRVLATLGVYHQARIPCYDERFMRELFDKRFKPGSWNRARRLLLESEAPKNLRHLIYIGNTIKRMEAIKISDYGIII